MDNKHSGTPGRGKFSGYAIELDKRRRLEEIEAV